MDWPALEKKLSLKMLGLTFFSKLHWGYNIISIAKIASKGIKASFHSMKFLCPVSLQIYHMTMHGLLLSYLGWCFYLLIGISRHVTKIDMQDCWSYFYCLSWNIASLSLPYMYYFSRCSPELAELVSFSYAWGRTTRYPDRLRNFSVTIPRWYKDVYVNSFFPGTIGLWNSLPVECFPLTYDLNDFKSKIGRYL